MKRKMKSLILRPITTAPRDDTEILLFSIKTEWFEIIDVGHFDRIIGWRSDYGDIEEPTHWLPLPRLPRGEPKGFVPQPGESDESPVLRPIRSAPMDGTEIMLVQIQKDRGRGLISITPVDIGCWEFIEVSDFDGMRVYGWSCNDSRLDEPTHWLPIPVIPESPADSSAPIPPRRG